jgi:hypothetical protein
MPIFDTICSAFRVVEVNAYTDLSSIVPQKVGDFCVTFAYDDKSYIFIANATAIRGLNLRKAKLLQNAQLRSGEHEFSALSLFYDEHDRITCSVFSSQAEQAAFVAALRDATYTVCAKCSIRKFKMSVCSCKQLHYCGSDCQRAHWQTHKVNCGFKKQ